MVLSKLYQFGLRFLQLLTWTFAVILFSVILSVFKWIIAVIIAVLKWIIVVFKWIIVSIIAIFKWIIAFFKWICKWIFKWIIASIIAVFKWISKRFEGPIVVHEHTQRNSDHVVVLPRTSFDSSIDIETVERQELRFSSQQLEHLSKNHSNSNLGVVYKGSDDDDVVTLPRPLWDSSVGKETVERFLKNMAREQLLRFSSQHVARFTNNYSHRLGSGGFGIVYKGKFPNGVELAVKVFNTNSAEKTVEEQFMAEVGTIGRTYHKNLVKLYGFSFEVDTKSLVYEYMENSSLDRILFDKENHNIEWIKFYDIAIGIAKGLAYLHHDCQQMIIHYDIKPGNVLLDSNFHPKIADFGLAKLCNRDDTPTTLTGGRGTPGYAAPELWMAFPVTYKCDVYSFGVMLFEIVRRRRNLDLSMIESKVWFPRIVWEKFEMGELSEMITDCGIEEKDIEKAKIMFMVALWCVQYLPEARPSMSSVVKFLEGGTEVMAPPNPFPHLVSSAVGLSMCMETNTESTRTESTIETNEKNYTTIMRKYEIEMANAS